MPYLPEVRTALRCEGASERCDFLEFVIEDEVLIFSLIIAVTDQIVSSFALEPNLTVTVHHNIRLFAFYLKPKVPFALAVVLTLQQLLVDRIQPQQATLEGCAFLLEADLPENGDVILPFLLLLHHAALLLQHQLIPQLILQGFHLPEEVSDHL